MSEHRVTLRDGAVLYVKLLGVENQTRPLIIATHGGLGVESHIEAVNSYGFLANYFRVLVYDMRGSGSSSDQGPYTHHQLVADLDELRAWAGAEQCIIAGSSYGGFVSMEYIVKHPQRVSCLLLRNTLAFGPRLLLCGVKAMLTSHRVQPDPEQVERAMAGAIDDADEMITLLSDLAIIYKPEFTASGERRTHGPIGRMPREKLHLDVFNFALSYNMPHFDVRPYLPSISVPTMVVGGKQDVITSVERVEEIAGLIPGAQLTILDGAGHNLPDDEPELWKQTVWQFLETSGFFSRA